METRMEESNGGGFFSIVIRIFMFLLLFVFVYYLITLYLADRQPENLIAEESV